MQIPICVVGCGGMGHRHMLGYKELKNTGIGNLEVVAVCDINRDMAELVADEAAGLLGEKPMVFDDLEKALAHPDIAAVDVVTDGASHHKVAVAALEAGKHAMVEKPLGVSVRACKAMIKASRENNAVLATAENYRRDPVMRLIRAIIDHGLIGEPHLMIQIALGHGDTMAATPWRHLKVMGAIGMDMGVHYADLFQYFLGEYDLIFGKGLIVEPLRKRPNAENDPLSSHRERNKLYPETIEATGADSVIACYTMESGAVVQLSFAGGRGSRGWERSIHGRWGAIYAPQGERTGGPVLLRLKDRELRGKEILAELPGFELDEIAVRLFGRDGVQYEPPTGSRISPAILVDAKHLAIEYHDFGEAIIDGRPPEVDGEGGMKAMAAIMGAYESDAAGRAVSMKEMLSGEVRQYQAEIDEYHGLEED